jgi:Na+-translocating ferredoxin:NAD+ oxidoreductase RnfD subunit
MTSRTLSIGGKPYPLLLPSVRDPRLHVAAVIISIHVLGQVGLHFRVSVPQILAAMLTCAIIEVALTFRQTRSFVWPASALLTGSGVALILRVIGTPPDDPWNTSAWYVFAGVAAFSILTKYVIRYRGSHVFNPSNIGLVVAFVLLGSSRVEPLDFWWAPLNGWMAAAYAVIVVGGLLITRRLRLLALAGTYWVALALGTGILAGSGHCMTTNWSFAPVCGFDFWRVIVTSPEVLVFLFFMITDPKTIPAGHVGRIVFGLLTAVASTLLMAPQTNEFGTKVGLLAGLVIVSAARPILDRIVPEARSAADDIGQFVGRLVLGGRGAGIARLALRTALAAASVLVVGVAIVAAGTPARGLVVPEMTDVLNGVPHVVDPATFPSITVEQEVADWDHTITGAGAQDILLTLAQNLEIENQALLRGDPDLLVAVDHGDRLAELQDRLADAEASGRTVIEHYRFDAVRLVLIVPFGEQTGISLGFVSRGTVVRETYDADGALLDQETSSFDLTFAVRRATGSRWLTVGVLSSG